MKETLIFLFPLLLLSIPCGFLSDRQSWRRRRKYDYLLQQQCEDGLLDRFRRGLAPGLERRVVC